MDALAAGRSFDAATEGLVYLDQAERSAHRLFVLAAGNIDEAKLNPDHLSICDTETVHDPAHAWNALTVGAFTEKATIEDADYDGWVPVATPGDLSPWSSTGVTLSAKWPNKPDVVFEGGNVATDGRISTGASRICVSSPHSIGRPRNFWCCPMRPAQRRLRWREWPPSFLRNIHRLWVGIVDGQFRVMHQRLRRSPRFTSTTRCPARRTARARPAP